MKIDKKQIGIILILAGFAIFISPNFMSIFGAGTQMYPFYCTTPSGQNGLEVMTSHGLATQYIPQRQNGFTGNLSTTYSVPVVLTSATYKYAGFITSGQAHLIAGANSVALTFPQYALVGDADMPCASGVCHGYWDCNSYNSFSQYQTTDITSLLQPYQGQDVQIYLDLPAMAFISADNISMVGTNSTTEIGPAPVSPATDTSESTPADETGSAGGGGGGGGAIATFSNTMNAPITTIPTGGEGIPVKAGYLGGAFLVLGGVYLYRGNKLW